MSKNSDINFSELPERKSTINNPFRNVDIMEYNNPNIFKESEGICDKECKKNFYSKLFRSPEDYMWQRQSSERQFITNPVTTVPNKQTEFAEWLYGKKYVGKSGSIYDRYGNIVTPDSMVNTGYNAAVPTNGGQTENADLEHNLPYTGPYTRGYYTTDIPGVIHPPNLGSSFK